VEGEGDLIEVKGLNLRVRSSSLRLVLSASLDVIGVENLGVGKRLFDITSVFKSQTGRVIFLRM